MNSFLRRGPALAGASEAGDLAWRRVPKVNLLTRESQGLGPTTIGLLIAFVVVGATALYMYQSQSAAGEKALEASQALDQVEALKAVEEAAISDAQESIKGLDQQISGLGTRGNKTAQAYDELARAKTDWSYAIDALLRADGPDLKFRKVSAAGERKMKALGTATGVSAFGKLQEHITQVEDVLILERLHWEPGDSNLAFTADLEVK